MKEEVLQSCSSDWSGPVLLLFSLFHHQHAFCLLPWRAVALVGGPSGMPPSGVLSLQILFAPSRVSPETGQVGGHVIEELTFV